MYKEILVPLDGSTLAESALPHACELAKAFGARITLLSLVEPVTDFAQWGVGGFYVTSGFSIEGVIEDTKNYLNEVADRLRTQGLNVRAVVEEGYAASEICDYAKAAKIDVIVMSTHGRSGIQRWVYGSVADRVLRGATVPILLIRALAG